MHASCELGRYKLESGKNLDGLVDYLKSIGIERNTTSSTDIYFEMTNETKDYIQSHADSKDIRIETSQNRTTTYYYGYKISCYKILSPHAPNDFGKIDICELFDRD